METILLAVDSVYGFIFLVVAVLAALNSNRDLTTAKRLVIVGAMLVAARWTVWAVTTEAPWPNRAVVGAIFGALLFTLVPAALLWIEERSKGAEATVPTPAPIPTPLPKPQVEKEIAQPLSNPVVQPTSPLAPPNETKTPQKLIEAQEELNSGPSGEKGNEEVRQASSELATHEELRRRAYAMADEILAFWNVYREKQYTIIADYKHYYLKDDNLLRLDNEASQKFKEQFSNRYNELQNEILKITKSDWQRMIFDNSMIGVDAIFLSSIKLKEMAKNLK